MAKLDEKFIIQLQGKDFVKYEGLLDLAHQNGLKTLEVEILQYPNKENDLVCICKAVALSENKMFTDIGDASPRSVSSNLAPHIIRMASTRAKARALRDFNNIGMTSIEEMLDEDDGPGNRGQQPKQNYQNNQGRTNNKKKDQVIDIQKIGELRELLRLKKIDESVILKFNHVSSIEEMNDTQYQNAKNFLSNR